MKNFKIVHVVPYFLPHLGGMERRVRELTVRLDKKGYEVEVFTSDIGCKKDKIKSTKNLKIHYLKSFIFANTPIIPSFPFFLMVISKNSIIHTNAVDAFTPNFVYLVSKLRGIPYVVHIPGNPGPKGFFSFLLEPYKKIFLKRIIRNAQKVICLNPDYKEFAIRKYDIPEGKVVVIPNSTNFKIANKVKQKKADSLLFAGRLSIEKNLDRIINAIFLIKNSKLKFYIVGEGEKKEELFKLIKKLKLEERVILTGRLEGEELYKLYLSSDIFLLPSQYECFSHTLLEAMATGTPIIASDIPGTRNIIKNEYNGLLVKPTPEKIAEAIEKLIKNPKLRKRLAENGLKEVKKYSWDKIVEQTEQVYREVLKEHASKNKQN